MVLVGPMKWRTFIMCSACLEKKGEASMKSQLKELNHTHCSISENDPAAYSRSQLQYGENPALQVLHIIPSFMEHWPFG